MSDKFKNVPVEYDTRMVFSKETDLGKYKVLYQKWRWEGVTAESIIFDSLEVADLTEGEIVNEVKSSSLLREDSQVTFKRDKSGYVFVNFNFIS